MFPDRPAGAMLSRRRLLQAAGAMALPPLPAFAGAPKIVSLDYGLASTLLSLGIVPAAVAATRRLAAEIGREAEAGRFPAQADAFFDDCRARLARKPRPPLALANFMNARHVRI